MHSTYISRSWRNTAITFGALGSLVCSVIWTPTAKAVLVPENRVQIRMEGFNLTGPYSVVGGQPTGDGAFKNGNAGEYPEGACIPSLISVKNNDGTDGDIQLTAYYDYGKDSGLGILTLKQTTTGLADPGAQADNLNDLTLSGNDLSTVNSFDTDAGGSVSAVINGPYSGTSGTAAPAVGDESRHYNMLLQSVPHGETVYVLFCAQLDVDASQYGGGAQMSVRTGEGGAENIAIQAVKLLVLPKLTLTKIVEGGTATPDQWSFNVSPAINGQSVFDIPDGQDSVVIDNIGLDGTYEITESGPGSYIFQGGSGENCAFNGVVASTTLMASKPQTTATCIFTNKYLEPVVLPKLTVTKVVVNDDGGTAVVSDFPLFVDGDAVTSGVENTFSSGTHTVSETNLAGYVGTFGGDCAADGSIALAEGDIKSCTITNDDVYAATTGTLTVVKQVINDDGGTKAPEDFLMNVTGTNVSMSSFAGSSTGVTVTLEAGLYSVDESLDTGYAKTLSEGCTGTMAVGDSKLCTITNDDIDPEGGWTATTGTLVVIKTVVNDNGGTKSAADFTFSVSGTNPSLSSFAGSAAGTSVTLDAGSFSVSEAADADYAASYGSDCSGSIAAGETKTCTVTNDDIYHGGGGGGDDWEATTGTLIVFKYIDSAYGGELQPEDFTLAVSGTSPTPSSFSGSSSGTTVVLGAGAYSVTEIADADYDASYGEGCTGTIAAGETVRCIVTNRYSPSETDAADLSVTKSASASSIQTGTTLDYLVGLTNIGPDPATNAQVSDVLPAGFIYQSSVASQGSYDSSSGIWTVGAMAVGATATLSMNVTVTAAAGLYVNTATATALEYDPNHANNVASHNITVTAASNGGGSGGGGGGGSSTPPNTNKGANSGGGGGSGFSPVAIAPPVPTPAPLVLGATDEATSTEGVPEPIVNAPAPLVLGATDELPRTGTPAWMLLLTLGTAAAVMRRKVE
ncbi:MAG: hypothetical protein RDU25_02640 [Patescibacteria group bacterium]|nr:hypothetical protein [Patescibacteria group bacterium]